MNAIEYRKMEENEKTYWWHVGRLRIIEKELARQLGKQESVKILNIGCGTGGTIKMLEGFGEVVNVDVSDEAINFMEKNGFDNIIKVEGIDLPFEDASFDAVCAFDVLEHIETDVDAVREWKRVLRPGGKIVITVPAHQWLWSDHDVSLHHYRRYTTQSINKLARISGLDGVKLTYAIAFSFPLIVAFRMLNVMLKKKTTSESSYVKLPPLVNKLFTQLLFAEADLHGVLRLPFGTSVMAVLKK